MESQNQLNAKDFINVLQNNGITFFAGVPDSLLKSFCSCVEDLIPYSQHVTCANEGGAIGLAVGAYLATGAIPLVYMQNSGLGNTINPLLSINDPEIYSIPVLLLIGWRGRPGIKDEPQHKKQGAVTLSLLDTVGIKYEILPHDLAQCNELLPRACKYMQETKRAFALIVPEKTFADYHAISATNNLCPELSLTREQAIGQVLTTVQPNDVVVATTGMISREVFEYRDKNNLGHTQDFLMVGGMGHSSMVAFGIAKTLIENNKTSNVFCLDGDGAVLMHMGNMAIIGALRAENLIHIVFNNGCHDSVGGQNTVGFSIDLCAIAKAVGYDHTFCMQESQALNTILKQIVNLQGTKFLEIRVRKGHRSDLGRPNIAPVKNKEMFMEFLNA